MNQPIPPQQGDSEAERTLAYLLVADGFNFEQQFHFAPPRKWRADFLVTGKSGQGMLGRLLVEVEGLNRWGRHPGKHRSHEGYEQDLEKYNAAVLRGFDVLRFSHRQIMDGLALVQIAQYFGGSRNVYLNGAGMVPERSQ